MKLRQCVLLVVLGSLWVVTVGACGRSTSTENIPDADDSGGGGSTPDASTGPTCAALGATCTSSSSCCDGTDCVQRRCDTCDGGYPQYCPQAGGACWTSNAACESVVDCGSDGLHACASDALRYDCTTKTCACPNPNYPMFCGGSSLPDQCWSPGTDCSTRTQCNGFIGACREGYDDYNCTTKTCTANIPSWLAGTWYQSGKTENNIYFGSDDWSVQLSATGTYTNTYGSNNTTSSGTYTWNPSTHSIAFSGGTLAGNNVALDISCRTIPGLKSGIYRHAEVPQCPVPHYVPAAACGAVGTYTKNETSGSISSSGSGTETKWSYKMTLYRDGFYTFDQSSFKTTCYQYSCTYLDNRPQTEVGRWGINSSNIYVYRRNSTTSWYDLSARLAGYSFAVSSVTCPGP